MVHIPGNYNTKADAGKKFADGKPGTRLDYFKEHLPGRDKASVGSGGTWTSMVAALFAVTAFVAAFALIGALGAVTFGGAPAAALGFAAVLGKAMGVAAVAGVVTFGAAKAFKPNLFAPKEMDTNKLSKAIDIEAGIVFDKQKTGGIGSNKVTQSEAKAELNELLQDLLDKSSKYSTADKTKFEELVVNKFATYGVKVENGSVTNIGEYLKEVQPKDQSFNSLNDVIAKVTQLNPLDRNGNPIEIDDQKLVQSLLQDPAIKKAARQFIRDGDVVEEMEFLLEDPKKVANVQRDNFQFLLGDLDKVIESAGPISKNTQMAIMKNEGSTVAPSINSSGLGGGRGSL